MKQHTFQHLALSLSACLACLGRVAAAQTPQRIDVAAESDFQKAISYLAEQGHVAVIAEGVPLHPQLSMQKTADIKLPSSLDDEMKAIAEAYDYKAQRTGNVFVLKKRYSDPDDLPAITEAECENALTLIQRVTDPYNPHTLPARVQLLEPSGPQIKRDQYRIINPIVNSFAASLTQGQLEAMQRRSLLVSSLSTSQQEMARQVFLSIYVQKPLTPVEALPAQLKWTEGSAVFTVQSSNPALHRFGYSLPALSGQVMPIQFFPLDGSTSGEEMGIIVVPERRAKGLDPVDPTDPHSLPVLPDMKDSQTLRDAVKQVDVFAGDKSHVDVDEGVASKPVSTAGLRNAPSDQVIRALAEVYGLRLMKVPLNGVDRLTLTLQDVSAPSALAALPSSLRQALPDPFRRAAHLDDMVAVVDQIQDFWQASAPASSPQVPRQPNTEETQVELQQAKQVRSRSFRGLKEFNEGQERLKRAEVALPALRTATIRRLRSLVESKLQRNPNGVAIVDLGEAEHEELATIFLADASSRLFQLLTQPIPESLLHVDRDVLSGGITSDQLHPEFSIFFNAVTSDGRMLPGSGLGGIDYIKNYGMDDKK